MKGKATAVLFIIIFLLILAVVCTFIAGRDMEQLPEESDNEPEISIIDPGDTVIIETPAPEVSAIPAPAVTSTPEPTPSPTLSPAPTPSPTPSSEPTPAAMKELGSGSFASDTGAKINIQADWSAKSVGAAQAEVTVKVILNSYSLHLNAVPYAVKINLGGEYVSLDAPEVNYDGTDLLQTTLAEKTFSVNIPDDGRVNLAVEWHFGGTYGDVELPVIECGGNIQLAG